MFKSTKDTANHLHKLLLIAHHGWGKTFQARHFAERYGKGLIISGERGLLSLSDVDIDYVDFSTWDRNVHPKLPEEEKTFREILALVRKEEFLEQGYKWIMIDSATEMSDRAMADIERSFDDPGDMRKWQEYERQMIGALKLIRDLPLHVIVTCLAKEERNDNDGIEYWPMVNQSKVAKKIPALFDHVFCGIRSTEEKNGQVIASRILITDTIRGWHGKARDPRGKLKAVEEGGNVVELLDRISQDQE